MNYAMIRKDKVIQVLYNQKTEPHYPPDPQGNPVTAVPCDETVKIGMMYDAETGTFYEYTPSEPEPKEPQPTQLDQIQSTLDYLAMMAE